MIIFVSGNALGRSVQKNLGAMNLWMDPFPVVKENLRAGISVCEQWTAACEYLTGQLWQRYTPHPWKNEKYLPEFLCKLGKRLEEVFCSCISILVQRTTPGCRKKNQLVNRCSYPGNLDYQISSWNNFLKPGCCMSCQSFYAMQPSIYPTFSRRLD